MNRNITRRVSTIVFRSVSVLTLTAIFFLTALKVHAQDAPVLEWAGNFKVDGGNEDSFGYSVDMDAAGNVYSTGSFNGVVDMDPGAGVFSLSSITYFEQDIYVSKLDTDGNFVWAVRLGSGQSDYGYSIVADASGSVYVTGSVVGGMDFDPGPGTQIISGALTVNNIFVLKLDTNGNYVWGTILGSTTATGAGRGITLDGSGNVLTTGSFTGTADFDPGAATFNITSLGAGDIFLSKLDANGNFVWAKSMGGTQGDGAFALAVDNSGNVITTGSYRGTADFDPSAAVFQLTTPSANAEIFVSKYDNNGNFIWAKSSTGSTGTLSSRSIDADGSGNIIFTGYFTGTLDFDPGAATFNLTSTGDEDVFISKLDANGNFVWAHSIGGSTAQPDHGQGVAVDASGNIVTTGYFNGTADFDVGPGTFTMISGPAVVGFFYRDMYILKLDNDGNFIWARSTGNVNQPDEGTGIATDASGNVTVTGSFSTNADFDFGPCTLNLNASFNTDINSFVEKISLGPTYLPTLTSVSPSSGPAGTVITITGTDFSPVLADNIVRFSSALAPVSAVTSTTITATIPAIANGTYNTRLQIGCVSIINGPVFTVNSGTSPTITSFTPTSGAIGTTVSITGTNFSPTPANNTVKFNGTAAVVTASTATSITTTVPSGATTGKITVMVSANTATSATNFTVTTAALPTITSFTPTSGPVGTTITITGTNFSTTPASNTVKFNGTTATVTASTATTITTTVPSGATTGKITVTVGANTATSVTDFTVTTPSPTITSFTPASGPIGTTVTITGTNFSATPANNTVKFNGTTAAVTASTTTSVTTTVPSGATTGKITVTVSGNTATSATNFTVTVAGPTITIDPQPQSLSTCEGAIESFNLDASGTTNITYQWQKFNGTIFNTISDGGGYSGTATKTLSISTSGNFGEGDYRCQLSGDLVTDVYSQTVTLTVNQYPVADITIDGIKLRASAGDSYQWHQNGNIISPGTDQTLAFDVTEFGVYTVEVTENGCTSASDEFVYLITEAGIEKNDERIKVYPNPFTDILHVEIPLNEKAEIEIVDVLGRSMKKYSRSGDMKLYLNELLSGSYTLIIRSSIKNLQLKLLKVQ